MRNSLKVAKWEIKRNLKNKTYLIGLFLTPLLFVLFMLAGSIFDSDDPEMVTTKVFVNDRIGVFDAMQTTAQQHQFNWELEKTEVSEAEAKEELADTENTAYIFVDQRALDEGIVPFYTSEEIERFFDSQVQVLAAPIKTLQMRQLGLTNQQLLVISKEIQFQQVTEAELPTDEGVAEEPNGGEVAGAGDFTRIVPGAFAGILLLSIIFSGMYIFQSASQEKKDKVAEIILSSLTPGELMQGKIIGYFVLGIVQSLVFLLFAIPIAIWKLDIPLIEYLLVPETLLLVLIAIMGYFLFAALFVGVGATMADITTAGNFQGFVMMLPFLPFVFIGPVVNNPDGLIAKIGTFIPFSAPGVLLIRLTMLEEWPVTEIIIALIVLLFSIWLFMKLAGKIFKTGILMYGKNATPKEMWKWIRS